MRKSLKWLFVIGPSSLVLLGVFIYARSNDPARVSALPAANSGVADEQLVEFVAADFEKVLPGKEVSLGKLVQEGISVEFSMARISAGEGSGQEFLEGDDVRFRFRIADTASDTPLTSVYPAAWLVSRPPGTVTSPKLAVKKAESMINASVFSPAELDLNVYYVMTLNSDATITVVDPLFGYGGTKLLALIPLKSTGADWALSNDETTVYVSLPESHEVAVIDTATWEVLSYAPGGLIPDRVALQPDGHYLWVGGGGYGERAADSGVTVLDTNTMEVAARIRTGTGRHDITFSDDSRFAFVTNSLQNTVSIIDVRTLKKRADVPTGKTPVSIDFSTTGQVAYVTHSADGSIAIVSGEEAKVVGRLQAEEGLGQIKFAPGGRLGFVVNPQKNLVHILDAATDRIVQSGPVEDGPDQIAFSDNLAYIRHSGSANVLMIPLDSIGLEGQKLTLIDFPAGQHPPGQMSRPCLATSMIQAPGASAMLVANPTDRAVYFYKEGMAAPMGTFNNYSREPLAVLVVDRSLRERTAPGVYETVVKLREPDSYDVVFFLDAPRITHCFPIDVKPDPALMKLRNDGKVNIEHIVDSPHLRVGQTTQIRFKLSDLNSGAVKAGLNDVTIQAFFVPASHERFRADEIEPGVYAIDLTPNDVGVYYITVASPTIGLTHDNPELLIMQAFPENNVANKTDSERESSTTDKKTEADDKTNH